MIVENDLSQVTPILESAKQAISDLQNNANKLRDLKSTLQSPPEKVKMVMTAAVFLITDTEYNYNDKAQWAEIRKIVMRQGFFDELKFLQVEKKKKKVIESLKKNYTEPKMKEEQIPSIAKAFDVAGTLAEFMVAQVKKADICLRVEPLTNEINKLEEEQKVAQIQQEENKNNLEQIKINLERYKEDYQVL